MRVRGSRLLIACATVAALGLLIVARRPDVLRRPQFWAEDGMIWYASAHNYRRGLEAALVPYGGYLQAAPRLAGVAAQAVDLVRAPLVMSVLALLIQLVAPALLLSDRLAPVVAARRDRLVLSLLLIAVPNMMEIHANVTNSQVHLALIAFLILVAAPARSAAWRVFDLAFLLLSGLSGPFCLFLLPVAVLCWLRERDAWNLARLAAVLAGTVVQGVVLHASGFVERRLPLGDPLGRGASLSSLVDLLGRQVFFAGLVGVWNYARAYAGAFAEHPWLPLVIGVLGLAIVLRVALLTRSFALRAFLLFTVLQLAASLTSPIIFGDKPRWELLKSPAAGQRYFYFATLAFVATLLWMAADDPRRLLRAVALALLAVLLLVGVHRDWRLPPYPDLGFAEQARRFAAAAPGATVELRIPPDPFTMTLVK